MPDNLELARRPADWATVAADVWSAFEAARAAHRAAPKAGDAAGGVGGAEQQGRRTAREGIGEARLPAVRSVNADVDTPRRSGGRENPGRVESALHALSADCPYDQWRDIAWAVRDALGDGGFDVFVRWSQTAPERFDEAACRRVWDSDNPGEGSVSCATLFHRARSAGWAEPAAVARRAGAASSPDDPLKRHDIGNSQRAAGALRGTIVHRRGFGWLRWDSGKWVDCSDEEALHLVGDAVRAALLSEAALADSDDVVKLTAWCSASLRLPRLRAVLDLLKGLPGFSAAAGDFDGDALAIQDNAGVRIDLRTGASRPSRPEDLMLRQLGTRFDATAECPTWERVVHDWSDGDAARAAFLQRAAGYCLTGLTGEQVFFFLYGHGGNGKSQFVEALRAVCGQYAATLPTETLMVRPTGGGGASPELARLVGIRLLLATETEEGGRLSEALVKSMTGGDTIIARPLYRDFIEFVPQFKLWMTGNHRPDVRGTDTGIWRRILLVLFARTFSGGERDPGLGDRLRSELPGILNWMLEGCRLWLKDGLAPPPSVRACVQQYRDDMDQLGQWLAERCDLVAGDELDSGAAFRSFQNWCQANGTVWPSKRRFTERLSDRGIASRRTNGTTKYIGLRFRTE